jgi:hypothetical protein
MEIIDSPQRGQCIYPVNWYFLNGTEALKKRSSFPTIGMRMIGNSLVKNMGVLRPYTKIN